MMHRAILRTTLLGAMLLCAGAAFADVKVRVAVARDSVPQGGRQRVAFALANTGHHPIGVRIALALVHDGQPVLGPFFGRTRLAAGERRMREFNIRIPCTADPGRYAFVARAVATDGTESQSAAPFLVVPRPDPCEPPPAGLAPADEFNNEIQQGTELEPESGASPLRPSTWGSLKARYR